MSEPIRVVCSWRKSNDFPASTVINLFKGCLLASGSRSVEFHCLTTRPDELPEPIIAHQALHEDWRGFWSKIELFRPGLFTKPVIYFDLDTIVRHIKEPDFDHGAWMIKDVGTGRGWASGAMAWSPGAMAPFYHDMVKWRKEQHFPGIRRKRRGNRDRCSIDAFPDRGDQQFMGRRAKELGVIFKPLQQVMRITSFKRQIRARNKNPELFDVICFHGKPRPQNSGHPWVEEYLASLENIKL